MSDINQYFAELREIEEGEIFIAESADELDKELAQNVCSMSVPSHLASLISSTQLLGFVNRVLRNRKKQLINSSLNVHIRFYMWFDEMASQLRFNFINYDHKRLPFACRYTFVESASEIIDLFLKSAYHDGIPFTELRNMSEKESFQIIDGDAEECELKVYAETLTNSSNTA